LIISPIPHSYDKLCSTVAHGRILLVDDNRAGLSVRKVVLAELGYTVVDVGCSLQALDRFCAEAFDLVVTDYRMPKLNGIELIGRIRQHQPTIPVVLISGIAEALGLNTQNTGADVVVQKSANEVTALTRGVLRLLSRKLPRKSAGTQRRHPARRTATA
jgi:CheY-like chemotaxis protein